MKHLKTPLLITLCVLVLVMTASVAKPVQAQELDRTLEIERYPNEPLELVSLRIGTQSVKEHIKQKLKDEKTKWAIDIVNFKEQEDWVKRLSITMRNTTDKPIYGLLGVVFFKPLGFPMLFSVHLTHGKELRREPIQPGAEIELTVKEVSLNDALQDAKNQGADLRGAVVTFSLDSVAFSDDLRWYRGSLMRPDPSVPHKWVPVNRPSGQ